MEPKGLLALGTFTLEDLDVSVSKSNRKIDGALEAQTDALWEEKKKKADAEGRTCYNGTSYRLNSLAEKDGRLIIDFGLLEYKVRSTIATIPGYLELGEQYHHKGCHTAATIKTSDGKYLIVELSGKSMNPHKKDMLGGMMEKPQEIVAGEDVFNCIYVELDEEARITKADIENLYLRSISRSPNTHVCFYFEGILKVSSEELLARFAKESADDDIQSLLVLTRDKYIAFLSNHSSPTKQLVAAVMLL